MRSGFCFTSRHENYEGPGSKGCPGLWATATGDVAMCDCKCHSQQNNIIPQQRKAVA